MSFLNLEPPATIRIAIDPQFSAMLVEVFACGLYTLLVVQTVWRLHRKRARFLYSSALLIMWISTIVNITGHWVKARAAFVSNNSSPLTIITNLNTPYHILEYVSGIIASSISNGIIIWRCHILWQSKIILSILILLFGAMLGFEGYGNLSSDPHLNQLMQALGVLSFFITTVSATFLITLKITLVTRQSDRHHYYTRIIKLLAQSAAIVSVTLLGLAILSLIAFAHPFNLSTTRGKLCYQLVNYLLYAQVPITGIGPTLLAFCVAEEPPQTTFNSTTRIAPLSRLRFRTTTGNANSNDDVIHITGPMESI